MGKASRIDPVSVASRTSPAKDGCSLIAPINGDRASAINLDCFKFSQQDSATAYRMASDPAVHSSVDPAQVATQMKQARNRLGFSLIAHSDAQCEREKGMIYANRAASGGALDFLSSGFSISSTIVGGEQAKSILSGLAGLSTATRTNIDANIYQNQLVSAVTKVMDAERSNILRDLRSRQSQSVSEFSADEVVVVANQYHQACSFQKGVQLLLDAAVNKEGVDKIVKAMNLRSTIAELSRNRETLISMGFAADSEEMMEIAESARKATLELFQISQGADEVNVSQAELVPDPAE